MASGLYVRGKPLSVDPSKALGKGMEADVYLVGNMAVKVFKDPSHPDLLTDVDREAARLKIKEHQRKLNAFPANLPPHVVAPVDLVQDSAGKIVGYTMHSVPNARQIRVYGLVSERLQGTDPNSIVHIFLGAISI